MSIPIAWILRAVYGAAVAWFSWVGVALSFGPSHPDLVGRFAAWTSSVAGETILVSIAAGLGAKLMLLALSDRHPAEQQIDSAIDEALTRFRAICFKGVSPKEPLDNNRVTLFQRRQWCWKIGAWRSSTNPWGWGHWPGSGWLVMRNRSGHATKRRPSCFLAPDDAPKAEGVAGRAWRGGAIRVKNLPDLSELEYIGGWRRHVMRLRHLFGHPHPRHDELINAVDQLIEEYAEATFTSIAWVHRRLLTRGKLPTCILAVPIEDTNGSRWGALVLDSCNTVESIDTNSRNFRTALKALINDLARLGVTKS